MLTNGKRYIVLDSAEEVLKSVESYYQRIGLVGVRLQQQKAEGADVSE